MVTVCACGVTDCPHPEIRTLWEESWFQKGSVPGWRPRWPPARRPPPPAPPPPSSRRVLGRAALICIYNIFVYVMWTLICLEYICILISREAELHHYINLSTKVLHIMFSDQYLDIYDVNSYSSHTRINGLTSVIYLFIDSKIVSVH